MISTMHHFIQGLLHVSKTDFCNRLCAGRRWSGRYAQALGGSRRPKRAFNFGGRLAAREFLPSGRLCWRSQEFQAEESKTSSNTKEVVDSNWIPNRLLQEKIDSEIPECRQPIFSHTDPKSDPKSVAAGEC